MWEFLIRFIRRFGLRKFFKNKLFVLIIAVVVVSLVYNGVEKVINDYSFYDNGDVSEEEIIDDLESGVQFAEDEVDLVLEDFDDETTLVGENGDVVDEESKIVDGDDGSEMGTSSVDEGDGGASATEEEYTKNKIYVYITGEVVIPGVVILDEGSRISDAINAAGGTTANANVSKVNLVYVLQDGMKVNIPNNSDLKNNPDFEYITTASGDGRSDEYTDYGEGASSGSSTSLVGGSERQEIVNINTATQTELESLPGIGPSLALKIINYRKENGLFSSIEDIKNVSGIGESKFEALKEYIRV